MYWSLNMAFLSPLKRRQGKALNSMNNEFGVKGNMKNLLLLKNSVSIGMRD